MVLTLSVRRYMGIGCSWIVFCDRRRYMGIRCSWIVFCDKKIKHINISIENSVFIMVIEGGALITRLIMVF